LADKEKVAVDDEVLSAIAEHAEGSLRDAEGTLGQVFSLGTKKLTMEEASLVIPRSTLGDAAELIALCLRGATPEAIALVNDKVLNGIEMSNFMTDIVVWLRMLLLAKVATQLDLFSQQTIGELRTKAIDQASGTSVEQLQRMIDVFVTRRGMIGQAPIEQLPCELAVVEVCSSSSATKDEPKKEKTKDDDDNKPAPATDKKSDAKVEKESKASSTFQMDEVKTRWQEVLDKVKELNRSLSYVLATALPLGISDGKLEIGVSYPFHQDRIREAKNRLVLAEATKHVFGQPLRVEAVLNESEKFAGSVS